MAIVKQHSSVLLWATALLAVVRCHKRAAALISQSRRLNMYGRDNKAAVRRLFFFCRRAATSFFFLNFNGKFSQECHQQTLFRQNNKLKCHKSMTFSKYYRISFFRNRAIPKPEVTTIISKE